MLNPQSSFPWLPLLSPHKVSSMSPPLSLQYATSSSLFNFPKTPPSCLTLGAPYFPRRFSTLQTSPDILWLSLRNKTKQPARIQVLRITRHNSMRINSHHCTGNLHPSFLIEAPFVAQVVVNLLILCFHCMPIFQFSLTLSPHCAWDGIQGLLHIKQMLCTTESQPSLFFYISKYVLIV